MLSIKKLSLIMFCVVVCQVYAQNNVQIVNYENLISMEPLEVKSSAVLIFDFETSKEITYKLLDDNKVISTTTFNKDLGKVMKKVDFSTLKNGVYLLEFYVDDKIIKQSTFNKM